MYMFMFVLYIPFILNAWTSRIGNASERFFCNKISDFRYPSIISMKWWMEMISDRCAEKMPTSRQHIGQIHTHTQTELLHCIESIRKLVCTSHNRSILSLTKYFLFFISGIDGAKTFIASNCSQLIRLCCVLFVKQCFNRMCFPHTCYQL